VYGQDISRELVSKVTDRVVADMEVWQARPLWPCPRLVDTGLSGEVKIRGLG
jgi:transposase-like protein